MQDPNFNHYQDDSNNNQEQNNSDSSSYSIQDNSNSQVYNQVNSTNNSTKFGFWGNFWHSLMGKFLIGFLVLGFFVMAILATITTLTSVSASKEIASILPEITSLKEKNKDFITNSVEIDTTLASLQNQKDEFWSKPTQLENLKTVKSQYLGLILKNQSQDLATKKDDILKTAKTQLNDKNQKLLEKESEDINLDLKSVEEYPTQLQKFDYFKAKIDELAVDEKKEILLAEIVGLKDRNGPILEFYSNENMVEDIESTNQLNEYISTHQDNKSKSLEELKTVKLEIDQKYETLISKKLEIEAERKAALERKKAEEKRQKELERLKQLQINSPEVEAYKLEPKTVIVDIASQSLIAYEYGIPIKSTFVTTGKDTYETVTGEFRIFEKKSPTILISPFQNEPYRTKVTYWMPFYGGYGLHDALWRSEFGGQNYRSVGTHGCVNLPFDVAEWMYGWSEVGTKVVVR